MPPCHVFLRPGPLLQAGLLGLALGVCRPAAAEPPAAESAAVDTPVATVADAPDTSGDRAAPVAPLTLVDCLELAYRQNLGYLIDQADLEVNHERLRQARSPFGFNADATLTVPSYRESRDLQENTALLTRFREEDTNFDYQGEVLLSQRVRHLGRFTISGTGFRSDFTSNRRQDFLEYSGDLRFAYQQQILTEPQEELRLRQAELSLAAGRSTLRRQTAQLETQVTNSFYDLVQGIRQLEILKQRLDQSSAALDLAQRKFEIGLLAEVQALRLEVEKLRAEADYEAAATAVESRRDALRQLLAIDLSAPLEVSTEVEYQLYAVDEEEAVAVGLARHTDMEQARVRRRVDELDLDLTRAQVGPSADLNAGVTIRGRGPDPADVGRTLERSLVSASIGVRLPLVDSGQRRALLRQAEIELDQSQLSEEEVRQRLVRQVREAVRDLRQAERQIGLRRAALEVAERTFDVEQSRFALGLADSQELLNAQTDLTAARTEALNAVVSYQRALQDLRLATMAQPDELVASAD